jgi:hypothetical protein
VFVLLAVVGIVIGAFYVKNLITDYEAELKHSGFEQVVQSTAVTITDPITEPLLLKGQAVKIMADCSTNLAVLAQVCEVYGKIDGTLYFRGQILTIQPGAEILGGMDVKAQVLQNYGRVEGDVIGEFQLIEPGTGSE